MKLSELIAAVGDENVKFQNLNNDAANIDKTKHGTKITFYTDGFQAEEFLSGSGANTKNIGLVIFLPRDRVNAAIAQGRAAPTEGAPS